MSTPNELELFDPSTDSDAAFFLPAGEVRKHYTAQQAQAVEWKRNLICMCIASGWPVEQIAKAAHVSTRTVLALAARESEQVAGKIKEFGQALHTLGARWYGLARAKEGEATFIQLAQAASFAVQRGSEVLAAAGTGEAEPEEVLQSDGGPTAAGKLAAWIGGAVESESTAESSFSEQNAAFTTARHMRDTDSRQGMADQAGAAALVDLATEEGGGGSKSAAIQKLRWVIRSADYRQSRLPCPPLLRAMLKRSSLKFWKKARPAKDEAQCTTTRDISETILKTLATFRCWSMASMPSFWIGSMRPSSRCRRICRRSTGFAGLRPPLKNARLNL